MNGDDMTKFAALVLVAGLLCMALTMNWYKRSLDDPLSASGLSRAMFAAALVGTAAALGLLVYDVSAAGPGFRTIMEAVAIEAFALGGLAAYESIGVDDAKKD